MSWQIRVVTPQHYVGISLRHDATDNPESECWVVAEVDLNQYRRENSVHSAPWDYIFQRPHTQGVWEPRGKWAGRLFSSAFKSFKLVSSYSSKGDVASRANPRMWSQKWEQWVESLLRSQQDEANIFTNWKQIAFWGRGRQLLTWACPAELGVAFKW